MSDYRQLQAHFKQYRSRVTRNTEAYMRKVAAEMTKDMRDRVPVDTGTLKGSIRYAVSKKYGEITVRIHANAKSPEGTKYAEFVEFGTGPYNEHGDGRPDWHGMKPQPFVRPAFAAHKHELQKMIQQTMRVD